MCGIVGYVGNRDATSLILDGLRRLEYRGYDSAGIALIQHGTIQIRRAIGNLAGLRQRIAQAPLSGAIGIGHTRWATHGEVAERNAHPHLSSDGAFAVVHNGIVENYQQLRDDLASAGVVFQSDTDSEVVAHLLAGFAANGTGGDLVEATRKTVQLLEGSNALVVLSRLQPDRIVAARVGYAGGLVVGLSNDENFIASDIPAVLDHTRQVFFLEDGQLAVVTASSWHVLCLDGSDAQPKVQSIAWDSTAASKGDHRHFMHKEIHEQPQVLSETLRDRVDVKRGRIVLPDLKLDDHTAAQITQLTIVACGTSYYSGLVGKYWMEHLTRLRVDVDFASEFRYRDPVLDGSCAVLAITQSGETADTLAAMDAARRRNALLWCIGNVPGSQAMRGANGALSMNAGPEIGVASTKAFTASLVAQLLLALYLAQIRGTLPQDTIAAHARDLMRLPELVARVLGIEPQIQALARRLAHIRNALFLGRGHLYPIALEGALKLKEISYVHAEGYPAGEMKHGPIALIDRDMPVVALTVQDATYGKMISQVEQVRARGAHVIAVATEGDNAIAAKADDVLYLPEAPALYHPILAVVPLQLLAYHMAVERGVNVDQPRNLAKSVTVE